LTGRETETAQIVRFWCASAPKARSLVEMADTLVDDYDVVDLLTGVADRCVSLLGVSAAALQADFASASAMPLRLRDVTLGALNLLSVTRRRD
jgi:hypothetical protein